MRRKQLSLCGSGRSDAHTLRSAVRNSRAGDVRARLAVGHEGGGRDELPGSDLLQPLLGLGHVFDLHVALGDVELVLEPEAALNCLSFQKVVERLLRPPVRDVWSDNRDRKRACAFDPRCGPHHHAPKKNSRERHGQTFFLRERHGQKTKVLLTSSIAQRH